MDFLPAPLSMIPPAVRDELRQVFDDLDAECCGLLTPAQVTGGLELNGVSLSHAEIAALIRAMDPTGSGWISFEPFLCCIYALSLTQREVCTSRVYAVFPDSDFPARGSTGLLRLRRAVWLALEDPQSSKPAFWTAVAIVVVIVASTLGIIVETFPDVRASNPAAFDGLEVVCAAFFSVELVLRAACTPYLATFLFQARTAVDILAVAPFYVTLIAAAPGSGGGAAGAALRVVRVLRVVRLFKLGRYVTWMRIFTRTFLDALPALGSEWRGYIRSRTRCQRWDSEASARGGRQGVYPSCGNAQGCESWWSSEGCVDAAGGLPPLPPQCSCSWRPWQRSCLQASATTQSVGSGRRPAGSGCGRTTRARPSRCAPGPLLTGAGLDSWRRPPPCLPSHSPSPRRSGSRSSP